MTTTHVETTEDGLVHLTMGHVSALFTPAETRDLADNLRTEADEAEKEVFVSAFIFEDGSVRVDVYESLDAAITDNGDPGEDGHVAIRKVPRSQHAGYVA